MKLSTKVHTQIYSKIMGVRFCWQFQFNIDVHPYFMFFRTNDILTQDENVIFDKKLDMLTIQKRLRDAFFFCLDADYDERLKDLSAMERYYIC